MTASSTMPPVVLPMEEITPARTGSPCKFLTVIITSGETSSLQEKLNNNKKEQKNTRLNFFILLQQFKDVITHKSNYILNKQVVFGLFAVFLSLNCFSQTSVELFTNKGKIVVELYDETPIHRDNFIKLVQENFYDSILFHRVIKDFMIQVGDPRAKAFSGNTNFGGGGPGYTLQAELEPNFIHKKGALAAARLGDDINPARKSSGSQFYIVQGRKFPRKYMQKFEEKRGKKYSEKELKIYETIGGAPHLDGQYTVFGEVVEGMSVVETIAKMPTNLNDLPMESVYIIKTKIVK